MTTAACVQNAVRTLEGAGFTTADARRDTSVIARHILGWDVTAWLTRQQDEIAASLVGAIERAVERRAAFEPVAYITGSREFFGRSFIVTRDVLIPRPETELLVEQALAYLDSSERLGETTVLDVGTGSGCIAVTLACERPSLRVFATDVSEAALQVARRNAEAHGVAARVTFACSALTGGLRDLALIISNPPYVAEGDKPTLAPDVRDWEPASALFAGADGLTTIRELIVDAPHALRPGGALMIEVGSGQAPRVVALMRDAGLQHIRTVDDLAGITRVVTATASDLL
jgi:release factor glutamine methyltransferase